MRNTAIPDLHSRRCDHEVRIDILLAKLLGNVQAERAVVVVYVALRLVTQYRVGTVHLLELQKLRRLEKY